MKRIPIILLGIILMCGLLGCSSNNTDKTKPVFETKNISRISFYAYPNHPDGVEVPSEHVTEIANWLGTFTIGEKADTDLLRPGSNSVFVEIMYGDGTIVKNGLSTFTVDGITYYMEAEPAPEFYLDIINNP